jgi:hypothetical protein
MTDGKRAESSREKAMHDTPDAIHAAVEQRFAQVARQPDAENKFPVGPASAKKLGYDPQGIDAQPPSPTVAVASRPSRSPLPGSI